MLTFKQFLRESLDDKELKSLKFRFYKALDKQAKQWYSYYKVQCTSKFFVDVNGKDLEVKVFSNKNELGIVIEAIRYTLQDSFYVKKEPDVWKTNIERSGFKNFSTDNIKTEFNVKDAKVTMELTIDSDIFDYGENKVSLDGDTVTLVCSPSANGYNSNFNAGSFEKAFKSAKVGEPFACSEDGSNFVIKGPNDTVVTRYFLYDASGKTEAVMIVDFKELKSRHFWLYDKVGIKSPISLNIINKLRKTGKYIDGRDYRSPFMAKKSGTQQYWNHLADSGSNENTVLKAFGIKLDSYRYSVHMYVTEKYLDDLIDAYKVDVDKFEMIKEKIKREKAKLQDKCLNMLQKVDNVLKDKTIKVV